ncbi:MAG: DegT/DnrJ/EryC1/StrS family aminotransferase [Planctomycetota bacterium]
MSSTRRCTCDDPHPHVRIPRAARRAATALRPELLAAMTRVLDSGTLILGPEVERFEQAFAATIGAPASHPSSAMSIPTPRWTQLDPVQAALLGVKLPHLTLFVAHRRELAARYDSKLSPRIRRIVTGQDVAHARHL